MPGNSPDKLASVRWLAELCGAADASTPRPCLASEMLADPQCVTPTRDYITWWMRHPDAGSTFESRTSVLHEFSDEAAIALLAQRGYEGLIYPVGDDIAGHVFFQNHGSEASAFSAAVTERYRGGKWWLAFTLDFVALAASASCNRRVSVGTGRSHLTRLLVKLLQPHASSLGWQVNDDGWIDFAREGQLDPHVVRDRPDAVENPRGMPGPCASF